MLDSQSFFDQLTMQASKNKTALTGLFVIILVGTGGYYAYKMQKEKYEEKAQIAYFEAEKTYKMAEETANPLPKDPKAKPKEETAKKPVDTKETEEKLQAVVRDYPDSVASFQASLMLAQIHMDANQLTKAIEDLEVKANQKSPSDLVGAILLLKLSSFYDQNKQCDKALPILEKLVSQSGAEEFKPEALLREGLCNETLGKNDKAKEIYQKLSTEFSDTQQGQQASKYLKLIKG
jgi:predicted negative regulator of RcsB-dependent stress response